MTTNSTAICVSLANSTSCPDLTSFSAYVGASLVAAGVSDATTLDSYILQASADGTGDSFGVAMRSSSIYDCPGWDGTGLRYQTTAVCVQLVWAGIGNTDTASPCNPTDTTMPICKSSMQRFINAWSKVFSNTAYCPSGQNDLAKAYSTDVAETENYLSTASGCVVAENAEVNNCGYNTLAEAQTFCSSDISGDTCCSSISYTKVTTAAAATTTTAEAASVATTTTASSSTSSNSSSAGLSMQTIIYIAAGGGAAVLIIAVVAIYCCCFRKKPKPTSLDDMYASGIGGGDAMKMKNRGARMGTSTPPKNSNFNLAAQKDTYLSKFNYTPQMPDELQTFAGDHIVLKYRYDDGWALGTNLRTGKEGQFPLDLLEGFDSPYQQQNIQKNAAGFNNRVSSLYGPPPGLTNAMSQLPQPQPQPWNQSKGGPVVPLPVGPINGNKGPNIKVGTIRTATMDFDPAQSDEMELRVGDTIQVKEEYDDGWAFGMNNMTQQSGLFPLSCVDTSNVGNKNKNHSLRMSSLSRLGGAPDALPAASATSAAKQTDAYAVVEDFDPGNPDEIELRVGDKIQMIKKYDDGWCTGLNLTTNQRGLLPLDCLVGFGSGPKPVTPDGKRLQKQRVSSIYDADFAGSGAKIVPTGTVANIEQAGDTFNVVEDFDPENPDEIELRVGDKVQVQKKYDDGWCTGLNLVTSQTGLLPLDCLAEFSTGQQKAIKPDGKKVQKQRVSSIYDADVSVVNGASALAKENPAGGQQDIFSVAEDFDPENPDEIELRVGDKVQVKKKYDDGWCTGLNMVTNQTGLLPIDCLAGFSAGPKPVTPDGKKLQKQRVSSIYDADGKNAPSGATKVSTNSSDTYDVVEDFDPENPDEIELRIGDKIHVKKRYDDGWCAGVNMVTNQKGLLPLDCLAGFSNGQQKPIKLNGKKLQKQRVSSVYDAEFSYGSGNAAPASNSSTAMVKAGETYLVAEDFDPENRDEIELRVGDKIQVKKSFDDGWCTGLNMVTGQTGLLPVDCLAGFGAGPKPMKPDGKKVQKQRVSSIYDADFLKYGDNAPGAAGKQGALAASAKGGVEMYTAVEDFDPENPDEIELRVGDKIHVTKKYDDGWCTGLNTVTSQTGLLPLDCLAGFSNGQPKPIKPDGKKMQKQRVSSIYDAEFSVYGGGNSSVAPSGALEVVQAVYDFAPSQNDEIEVRVGDRIELKKKFDDGWAEGNNLSFLAALTYSGAGKNYETNLTGLFPLDCLPGYGPDRGGTVGNGTSSMYQY
ncbi:Sorbin and SH3 domain-containing protein 2 [Entophlyctis luteolus]|nr:Sorbin and SH3 domain-containing protein 2 [Entophlyctis luteolus]